MNVPAELKYTASHIWLRREGESAVIGITDFAQEQLGEVTFVELPRVGAKFATGDRFGSVESIKAASDLFAPVSGEVLEVNSALEKTSELINISPYERGWMLKMRVADGDFQLLSAGEYVKTLS